MINNIEECIDLLKGQKDPENITDKDVEDILNIMRPFLTRKYGDGAMLQVEKLCMARNFDRAVKLLNSFPKSRFYLPPGRRGKQSFLIFAIAAVGAIVALFNMNVTDEATVKNNEISWIQTEGKIIHSRIGSSASFKSGTSEYYPDIKFSYYVDGTLYTSDSIVFDSSFEPESIVENYIEGDEVDILYNSENPDLSYLNAGGATPSFFWPMSIIIALTVIFMLFKSGKGMSFFKK